MPRVMVSTVLGTIVMLPTDHCVCQSPSPQLLELPMKVSMKDVSRTKKKKKKKKRRKIKMKPLVLPSILARVRLHWSKVEHVQLIPGNRGLWTLWAKWLGFPTGQQKKGLKGNFHEGRFKSLDEWLRVQPLLGQSWR